MFGSIHVWSTDQPSFCLVFNLSIQRWSQNLFPFTRFHCILRHCSWNSPTGCSVVTYPSHFEPCLRGWPKVASRTSSTGRAASLTTLAHLEDRPHLPPRDYTTSGMIASRVERRSAARPTYVMLASFLLPLRCVIMNT